jgi:hypothetical protein
MEPDFRDVPKTKTTKGAQVRFSAILMVFF